MNDRYQHKHQQLHPTILFEITVSGARHDLKFYKLKSVSKNLNKLYFSNILMK
jgi:hypothetical protein